MEMYDVVKRLLGNIDPIGETNTDNKRYENLRNTINLVDKLLFDISYVCGYKDKVEASMKKAGKRAEQFMNEIKET